MNINSKITLKNQFNRVLSIAPNPLTLGYHQTLPLFTANRCSTKTKTPIIISAAATASSPDNNKAFTTSFINQYNSLPPSHFSQFPLDKAAHLRSNVNELEKLLTSPTAKTVIFNSAGKALLYNTTIANENTTTAIQLIPSDGSTATSNKISLLPTSRVDSFGGELAACFNDDKQASTETMLLPVTISPAELLAAYPEEASFIDPGFIFLGLSAKNDKEDQAVENEQLPVFAVRIPQELEQLIEENIANNSTEEGCCTWMDVRSAGPLLKSGDAAVLATAAGLLSWHRSAAFCSRSGAPAASEAGGHARRAILVTTSKTTNSNKKPRAFYPRVDPAVIVAVYCGEWLLLGRKKSWVRGRYSLLAGFTELGETLEQATAREVFEESGVCVEDITESPPVYLGSQPWPFPSSLMLGFASQASPRLTPTTPNSDTLYGFELLSQNGKQAALEVGITAQEIHRVMWPPLQEVVVDEDELEDARWFHKDFLHITTMAPDSSNNTSRTSSSMGKSEYNSRYYPAKFWSSSGSSSEIAASNEASVVESMYKAFRIPGAYALANRIISSWVKAFDHDDTNNKTTNTEIDSILAAERYLSTIPEVAIDQGTFKYVLFKITHVPTLSTRFIVRGDQRAPYHNDILQSTKKELAMLDKDNVLDIEPAGGGRMEHILSDDVRRVLVYGYSAAYGQAPHEMAAVLLRKWLPLHDVSVSYDGY